MLEDDERIVGPCILWLQRRSEAGYEAERCVMSEKLAREALPAGHVRVSSKGRAGTLRLLTYIALHRYAEQESCSCWLSDGGRESAT